MSTHAILPISTAYTECSIDGRGDSDWYRLRLEKGQHYAFDFYPGVEFYHGAIRDQRGAIAKETYADWDDHAGLEYTAPYSGLYFFQIDTKLEKFEWCRLRVVKDCAGNRNTKCVLPQGKAIRGIKTFDHDVDFWRINAKKGVRHTVSLAVPVTYEYDTFLQMEIIDSGAKKIASCDTPFVNKPSAKCTIAFRIPKNKSYFLRVFGGTNSGDAGYVGTYTVQVR